ncbi:MAG: type II CRISPR-associated endonuclease Cas1 [Spirochaetales bacterium]
MFHQIIEVHEENRYLSLERGFLKISEKDVCIGRVALDDIAVLLISSQGGSISKNILVELAERGAITIFCGKQYSPEAIVYPTTGNYRQAGILKYQIDASIPFTKNIWKKLVQTKIENQAKSLELCEKNEKAKYVAKLSGEVKSGDSDNKEGQAARLYWSALFGKKFLRDRHEEGINSLLNYGYAIMRSAMVRSLCSVGLNPALGVHHKNVLNPFCLADDFFEIYRPIVDCIVYSIIQNAEPIVCPDVKKILIQALWVKIKTTEGYSPAFQSMNYMCSSFVKALKNKEYNFAIPLWEGNYEQISFNE